MSSKTNHCQVCGRGIKRLEGELGIDPELEKDQGIWKCSKCIDEYEIGIGRLQRGETEEEIHKNKNMDWKDQITA